MPDASGVSADAVIGAVLDLALADAKVHIRERAILTLELAQAVEVAQSLNERLQTAHAEIARLNQMPPVAGETAVGGPRLMKPDAGQPTDQ